MRLVLRIFYLVCCVVATSYASVDTLKFPVIKLKAGKTPLQEVGALPKILKEASGLEFTGLHFWSHNDDGIPAVYCLDSAGHLLRAVQLNTINRGWEDLTLDDAGNLYIGAFGNNKNDKKDLKIYRIPNPDSIAQAVTVPDIISYSYSDQKSFPPDKSRKNFDVDALFEWDGWLYLFTKNRSVPFRGVSKIYRLSAKPGQHTAELIDSLYVGDGPMINNWITGADLSPDKKTLALLFHDRVWLLRGFTKGRFSSARVYQVDLNNYSHKAGICFRDDHMLFIVDELEANILGGLMYKLDLTKFQPEMRDH